jgi:glutamate-ammonia-ligase adenylyltransferase
MSEIVIEKILSQCADPTRLRHYLGLLETTDAKKWLETADDKALGIFGALICGSEAAADKLVANPEWIPEIINPEQLLYSRSKESLYNLLKREIRDCIDQSDYTCAFARLRVFKQKETIRIAARDLSGIASVDEVLKEISALADVVLQGVYEILWKQFTERFGTPYHKDTDGNWVKTGFAVIGLGKLGGNELNYSSDIDVLFVYSNEGRVFKGTPEPTADPYKGMSNHQFFIRFAEAFISEVSRPTAEGRLYRIDLRLRPEGKAGPLARSLESYENFYAQYGQTWERMMLIKARGVAGDERLAHEFIETIQPFRFPTSISDRVLTDIAEMKERIENEVVRSGEETRNIKLGRGGIREIEFIVQIHQLMRGGKNPFIQEANTLQCLKKLSDYEIIPAEEANVLTDAYRFLRKLEHRLQMEKEMQTHTVPESKEDLQRLARLMGYDSVRDFKNALKLHTGNVRKIYNKYFKVRKTKKAGALPESFEENAKEWIEILRAHKFRDPEHAFKLLKEFVHGPEYAHISQRTKEVALGLVEKLLMLCPNPERDPQSRNLSLPLIETVPGPVKTPVLSDPDRVIARLDSFVSAYGARSTLYEMWEAHPAMFELILLLFDRSEFLAETAIRTPDLIEDLVITGRLRRAKTVNDILDELRLGAEDTDQYLWIRKYHEAERMRIGLRDILGLADFDQCLKELSALADACLIYALEITLKKHGIQNPPFAIIGMGKLGGEEIDYGSDLDVIFVASPEVSELHRLQSIAAEIMDLLSRQTTRGILFKIDARLRPDGEKGLLVNTLDAYEEYYRKRAQLWEIQALTRSRPIAGNIETAQKFQELASRLTNFKSLDLPVAAYKPDWKKEIVAMRMRIEKERTPQGKNEIAIKTGTGGLMDAEFIAQTMCLENGWHEPNTLLALLRAKSEKVMPEDDIVKLIENYKMLRRVEGILRRWSYEGEVMLPDDPAPYYRVSVRCGFETPEQFRQAVKNCRAAIREVFNRFFNLK